MATCPQLCYLWGVAAYSSGDLNGISLCWELVVTLLVGLSGGGGN